MKARGAWAVLIFAVAVAPFVAFNAYLNSRSDGASIGGGLLLLAGVCAAGTVAVWFVRRARS